MKLWLISQDANDGYDTYDSAVVAAAEEDAARCVHPSPYYVWGADQWHFKFSDGTTSPERGTDAGGWSSPELVTVRLIGEAADGLTEGEVVCASFNAG